MVSLSSVPILPAPGAHLCNLTLTLSILQPVDEGLFDWVAAARSCNHYSLFGLMSWATLMDIGHVHGALVTQSITIPAADSVAQQTHGTLVCAGMKHYNMLDASPNIPFVPTDDVLPVFD